MAAATNLNEKTFVKIILLLERFFFRVKTICNVHPGVLKKPYLEFAKYIRDNPQGYRVNDLREKLSHIINEKANDSFFESMLTNNLKYNKSSGNKPLKYFLTTVEHYMKWCEDGAQGTPKCADTSRIFDFTQITIEHIYPQNPPANIKDINLEQVVQNLGNLTFLGPEDNDAAGNKSFTDKKNILQNSNKTINKKIAECSVWDRSKVEEREHFLKQAAKRIFSI